MTVQHQVVIFKPSRHTMQTGLAKTDQWILQFIPSSQKSLDPLMGWTSSADTTQQLKLTFQSQEAAVVYATQNNFGYRVLPAQETQPQAKVYADNFSAHRIR